MRPLKDAAPELGYNHTRVFTIVVIQQPWLIKVSFFLTHYPLGCLRLFLQFEKLLLSPAFLSLTFCPFLFFFTSPVHCPHGKWKVTGGWMRWMVDSLRTQDTPVFMSSTLQLRPSPCCLLLLPSCCSPIWCVQFLILIMFFGFTCWCQWLWWVLGLHFLTETTFRTRHRSQWLAQAVSVPVQFPWSIT